MSNGLVAVVILAAIVVAIAVVRLAWSVLEEIILEHRDGRDERRSEDRLYAASTLPAPETRPRRLTLGERCPTFDWPTGGEYLVPTRSVEPIRQSFRSMLEGGPDYRG